MCIDDRGKLHLGSCFDMPGMDAYVLSWMRIVRERCSRFVRRASCAITPSLDLSQMTFKTSSMAAKQVTY